MKHLSEMSISEILAPEGYRCSCGKVHRCALKDLRIGAGVLRELPDVLRKMGVKRPFIVSDRNTETAAGKLVKQILRAKAITFGEFVFSQNERIEPDERAVGAIAMAFDPKCDCMLAVGSGVMNDCCKVFAKAIGKPSLVVATAPSMDGYASNSSSMIQSRIKVSLYNGCPQAIIADTDVLKTAPDIMLQAGLGDMLAKYVSVCEWRISHLVYGDPYCEEIADLVRASLRKIVAHADGLLSREDAALEAVLEGLVLSGVSMAFAEISRPASGLEHYFSHLWEMQSLLSGAPGDLHGVQVGVGTQMVLWIYENILNMETIDVNKARAAMGVFSPAVWEERVRRVFGPIAPEILALEAKAKKNDPEKHTVRLQKIADNWQQIRQIVAEELPDREAILKLMKNCGMKCSPQEMQLTLADTQNALLCSRDIRDKYLTSSLLWDLGLLDETAARIGEAFV